MLDLLVITMHIETTKKKGAHYITHTTRKKRLRRAECKKHIYTCISLKDICLMSPDSLHTNLSSWYQLPRPEVLN